MMCISFEQFGYSIVMARGIVIVEILIINVCKIGSTAGLPII